MEAPGYRWESKDVWESQGRSIKATDHHYLGPGSVAGQRKQAGAVKNGAETTPSGTWRDAEGDINCR